ncbi:MAG: alkaline phosphatase family protein [Clostridiales bacterium]|nr:alkaline phosphatase family protein [Clostridiales bacterium]
MDYCRPDYDNCLVNLSNSMLKYFGAQTSAPTLKMADRLLESDHRNVVLLLMDAMGTSILEQHLEPDGFLRSHMRGTYSSVFPPTTVAATTSVLSGLYPNEHGWLGWDMFFPELGKNVTVFTNNDQVTEADDSTPEDPRVKEFTPAADFNVASRYCPYKNIIDRINEAGGEAYVSNPYYDPFPKELDSVLGRVHDLCELPGKKFIYAYWMEPDSTMHLYGPDSNEARELVISLEKKLEEFSSELDDTLLLITADHSQVLSRNLCLMDYPEIIKCLVRMPTIEPRTLSFFVKDEYLEVFPELFRKTFGDKFLLLTKEEVIEQKLFGMGNEHPIFRDSLGEYVAISVADESIFITHKEAELLPGGHAGLTKEEIEIPLIAVF